MKFTIHLPPFGQMRPKAAAEAAWNSTANRPDLRQALEAELLKFIQEGHEYALHHLE